MSDRTKYSNDSALKDAWLHGLVEAALMLNIRLNRYKIKVEVINQTVTLFGEVNTHIDEWLCLELFKGIKEIKNITSRLTVIEIELITEDINQITSQQSFLNWYNDTNTTAEVKAKLLWNKSLSGEELDVRTENGVVTLSGKVDYKANKSMAEIITSQVLHVQEVRNQIEVNG